MSDQKMKLYFKLLKKNEKIFEALLKNKASKLDRQKVALCLSEIYFGSQHIIELIKKISETNTILTESSLDSLLENLCFLQVEIYDELIDWIKDLKKPLNIVIDKIGKLGGEKSGANIAIKNIQSSKKQIDINIKKIKYYDAHYKPKRKKKIK